MNYAEYLRSINSSTIAAVNYYQLAQAAEHIEKLESLAEEVTRMASLPPHLIRMAKEILK